MKARKYLCRFTSALIAVVMLIGIFPIISFADDGVLLNYTFSSEEAVTVNFQNNISGTLYKYDGFGHTFLRGEEGGSVWGVGWYNYDVERNGLSTGIPTENELFMDDGKLHARMAKDNHMHIYVPVPENNADDYDISFDFFDLTGKISVYVDNANGSKTYLTRNGSATAYNGTRKLQNGDFLRIDAVDVAATFAIDNLKIQKHVEKPFEPIVTSSFPAKVFKNGKEYKLIADKDKKFPTDRDENELCTIRRGDIIRVNANAFNGDKIKVANVLARVENGQPMYTSATARMESRKNEEIGDFNLENQSIFASVLKRDGNALYIQPEKTMEGQNIDPDINQFTKSDSAVYICPLTPNSKYDEITVGTIYDIITHEQSETEYSKMFVFTSWCLAHMFVIYK